MKNPCKTCDVKNPEECGRFKRCRRYIAFLDDTFRRARRKFGVPEPGAEEPDNNDPADDVTQDDVGQETLQRPSDLSANKFFYGGG